VEGLVEIGLARDSVLSPALRVGAAYATGGMNVDAGRASFSVLAGALAACPLRLGKGDDAKVQLVPCARFEIGDIHGQGEGIPAARDQRSLWTAGGLEVAARWKVHSALTLELTSALLLPLRRHTYVIDPQRVIHQTGALVFQAGGGALFSAL
jgi:hypothetical protein